MMSSVVTRSDNSMDEGLRERCVNFSYSYLRVLLSSIIQAEG
jgi:hypothetical protein